MNKRYKLLLKRLLLCSLLAGSTLAINSLKADSITSFALGGEADDVRNAIITFANNLKESTHNLSRQKELVGAFEKELEALNEQVKKDKESYRPFMTSEGSLLEQELNQRMDLIKEGYKLLNAVEAALAQTPAEPVELAAIPLPPALSHLTKSRPMGPKGRRLPSRRGHKPLVSAESVVSNEQDSTTTDVTPTLDVAVITEQLEEQKAELAQLEQEKTAEEKELIKTETKLEEVKVLPLEPVAPIKKKVATHKQKIAQKDDAIGVCKRKIYLLKQAQLKAARRAAAQEAADQPKKQQSVQDFYGVKKTPKRKSRVRGSRVTRRGPARKKSTKRGVSRKKSNKRSTKRKGSAKKKSTKKKQARRQAQQSVE